MIATFGSEYKTGFPFVSSNKEVKYFIDEMKQGWEGKSLKKTSRSLTTHPNLGD